MKSSVVWRWIAVVAVLNMVAGVSLFGQSGAKAAKSYVAGKFALVMDGGVMGYVKGIEGGEISADVIKMPAGPSQVEAKRLGQPRFGDIFLEMGAGLEPGIYDFIADTWARKSPRKSGAISSLSFDNKEMARTEFFNALLTETVIPSCDASDKSAAYMGLRLTPDSIRMLRGSGGPPSTSLSQAPARLGPRPGGLGTLRPIPTNPGASGGNINREARAWLPSNFRLTIEKIDASRVSKIDAFSVKQGAPAPASLGTDRFIVREPGKIEYPNLVLYIPEPFAQPWKDWFEDFVIRGNNGDEMERSGSLEFLSPNLQSTIFTITFKGLGICRLTPASADASAEQVRRIKVELYCEEMTFKASK